MQKQVKVDVTWKTFHWLFPWLCSEAAVHKCSRCVFKTFAKIWDKSQLSEDNIFTKSSILDDQQGSEYDSIFCKIFFHRKHLSRGPLLVKHHSFSTSKYSYFGHIYNFFPYAWQIFGMTFFLWQMRHLCVYISFLSNHLTFSLH